MTRDEIAEQYDGEDLLFMDPEIFDEAVIGVSDPSPGRERAVVYDRAKVIEILARDMTEEEAEEYFQFNVVGGWVGDRTPIYVELLPGKSLSEVVEDDRCRACGKLQSACNCIDVPCRCSDCAGAVPGGPCPCHCHQKLKRPKGAKK